MRHHRLKNRVLRTVTALAWAGLAIGCTHLPSGARLIRPDFPATNAAETTPALTNAAYFQPRTAPSVGEALANAE